MRAWFPAFVFAHVVSAISVHPVSVQPYFDDFVSKFGRKYKKGSAEYAQRSALFEARGREAEKLNSRPSRRWTAGANGLWDLTDDEFRAFRGWRVPATGSSPLHLLGRNHTNQSLQPLPHEKSWAHLGSLHEIREQGACGSCWAIAAATAMTAHAELHTGHARSFSVQEIISCVLNPNKCGGTGGCGGATMELAMEWVFANGCPEESQVPYEAAVGICGSTTTTMSGAIRGNGGAAFGMHGFENLPVNEQLPLMRALVEKGPVGVSVAGGGFNMYSSGIFDWCSKDAILDHAVVLIGYGSEAREPGFLAEEADMYWTLQNSWGPYWGEHGRMRLLRFPAAGDWCGIDDQPELGTGCEGGPPTIPVCGMCGMLYNQVVPIFG